MAEFVHEVNGLLGLARSTDEALEHVREAWSFNPELRRELASVHQTVRDLRSRLERHASYLVDVVTPTARRRRSAQSLADRFDAALRLVGGSAKASGIRIKNKIPGDLRTPPMYPAELTAVFANLLTNAVKNAGTGGEINATASRRNGAVIVRISNTGSGVNLTDADRWFRPFESTTTVVDPVLGQGMGLGLPITRAILDEYGATIGFVKPRGKYTTAIEISFKDGR